MGPTVGVQNRRVNAAGPLAPANIQESPARTPKPNLQRMIDKVVPGKLNRDQLGSANSSDADSLAATEAMQRLQARANTFSIHADETCLRVAPH